MRNAVKAAKTRVEAGQADLRGTELAIFSQVVAAYIYVILGEAIVGLRRNQVDVLDVNLKATLRPVRDWRSHPHRLDAQSQARLSLAQGDARTAAANLSGAREAYIRLVGSPPGTLAPPPPLPNLPELAESAVTIALENNPDIIAAREEAQAARYDIDVAGSKRLPKVSLYSQAGYNDYFGTLGSGVPGADFAQSEKSAQVGARLSLPLFQGGRPAAQRRQAQAFASAAMEAEIAAERDTIAQTRASWSSWVAARDLIESTQVAVDAAQLSLEGVRAENTVGNRHHPRYSRCRAGTAFGAGAAGDGAAQRLCCRVLAAGGHGSGRGARSRPRWRRPLRSAVQL